MRAPAHPLPFACMLAVAAGGAVAQTQPATVAGRRSAGVDPWTKGELGALARAGYVSLGPFVFGHAHTSYDVEQLLGDEPLAWIETAHFRIGCSVSPLELRGDRDWVARTKKDLAELARRVPAVRADARELDAWLRAHLIALRCEAIYAEVRDALGKTDAAFPAKPGHDPGDAATFLGNGPFLGMPEKFAVLIVRKGSSLARYTRRYMGGRETTEPMRHYEHGGAMVLALAEESTDGLLRDDFALHTQLVYNLAFQLYNGYRGYGHELPVWLSLGLAHTHSRRVCPRYTAYERRVGQERESTPFWKWNERAVGLARNGVFEPLAALTARTDAAELGVEQHIQAWSVVDWMQRVHPAELRAFVHELKAPFHRQQRAPSAEELRARASASLQLAFGSDVAALEAAWRTQLLRGRK
jgi:hypothetical protein